MTDTVVRSWRFASSSGSRTYETLQYDDGSLSCNCMGWTMKKSGQERTCRHCRSVQAGQADVECIPGSSLDLARGVNVSNRTPIRPIGKVTPNSFDKAKVRTREKVPARKILWK